ncbi:uncharacterized protein LOC115891705 [Sitophilus oryzae]|uniref:Uncharacterized protein LOC115891705 n=1 Tax=Sitophilus oryzae TaxID=7048 RepID=A0A6J2YY43_SITOR|nr:uncharacterized protein LOC115891705 [Sitophilus oryzae]
MKLLICFGLCAIAVVAASPKPDEKSLTFEEDPIGYLKEYLAGFLDSILSKDNHEFSDDVKVTRNSYRSNEISSRSNADYEDKIENYIKSHDVHFKLPVFGSVTVEGRNLDSDELDFKVNFGTGVQEARKSKLKKIFIPILVFVLLKAITLVPLALGILSLKAFNALQLSFFSFIVSIGLAIFQLCKKIASDNAAAQLSAHEAWPAQQYYARSFEQSPQSLAFSAYRR